MKLRLPHASLRTRIIAWSFVPTTIILLAVALVVFNAYQRVTEDLVVGRNQELTRLSAGQLASGSTSYADTLSGLARTSDIYQADPATQAEALRRASSQLIVFDAGTIILNDLGKFTAAYPARSDVLGQDWSSRPYFHQILRNAAPAFSDVVPDGPQGANVIAFAVPILNEQGKLRGTMVGLFRLGPTTFSAFYAGIVKLRIGADSNTYLVDSAGRVIYHPNAGMIGADLHSQPVVQQLLKNQSGFLRTHDVDGRDILATYAPVPGTPWGLVNEEIWTDLLVANQGYGQSLLLLLGLGVIVPTLVVTFGVRRITGPVEQLIAAAKEVAGGKYGQQITVHTGDELEELVAQFNHMSAQLSESYAQLEQRVAARTRELAALNVIAAVASRSLELQEVMDAALDKTCEVIKMELGAAYCIEARGNDTGEGDELVLIARRGLSEEFVCCASPRPLRSSAVEVAAAAQQPLVWPLADYPDPEMKQALQREGAQQVICVPLLVKGRWLGAFILGTRQERTVAPEELALLAAIGQQVGVAVENAHLYTQAERSAALAERTRLARELHDSVTQSLYSVTLYAEATRLMLESDDRAAATEHLLELRQTAQEALREMRLLIFELRPLALEKHGLAGALESRLEAVEGRGGMKTELRVEGAENLTLAIQQEIYHIAQEALNNVVKHSHAHNVRVQLQAFERSACLEISDDGVGFDPLNLRRGGLGLGGMQERAQKMGGSVQVESAVGKGVKVVVHVPLK
jgi:signal transduction histidine kinase